MAAMPKLHDACQILVEEIIDRLAEFTPDEAPYALALACHAVESDLALRHPDAGTVAAHLWLVLAEQVERRRPDLAAAPPGSAAPLPDSDIRLNYLMHSAVQSARALFPAEGEA